MIETMDGFQSRDFTSLRFWTQTGCGLRYTLGKQTIFQFGFLAMKNWVRLSSLGQRIFMRYMYPYKLIGIAWNSL